MTYGAWSVVTQHPIASSSVDHLHPRGTKNDNSTNPEFVRRLPSLVGDWDAPYLLDLGCSGGGFVEGVNAAGGFAIGIEGSDYSKRADRAAWARLGGSRLFTADIGQPFLVTRGGLTFDFNVITMWEVLEHLELDELERLNLNLHAHLARGGFFICSINSAPDRFEGVDYHRTIRPAHWWAEYLASRGWRIRVDWYDHFHPHWVRGPNTEGEASTCFVFQR